MCSNEPEDHEKPRLNFDVLRLICNDLTDVSDVLSFALTCSALSNGAFQRRLEMSPVILAHPDSVERFHNFIFADPTSRAPYLYGLSVFNPDFYYDPKDNPRPANYLAPILEAATHLEYLSFATTFGQPVCRAIAKLTTLRELSVRSNTGPRARQHPLKALNSLLTSLRSPLQSLHIADYGRGQISASFFHDHLSHFAPTLESLEVEDFSIDIAPSSVTTPFTALRSLKIYSVSYPPHFYRLDVLLRLFPNLNDTLILKGPMPPVDEDSVLRQQSKETQRDHTWPGLDRVVYSADLAFVMALQCPIRLMEIYGWMLREPHYLADALCDSCPRQLLLPILIRKNLPRE